MPRTRTSVSPSRQLRARTAAKAARLNEAGLGGRRTGKALATNQRAQASRDQKSAAAAPSSSTAALARKMTGEKKASTETVSPAPSRTPGPVLTIQVNTSSAVPGDAAFVAEVHKSIQAAMARFAGRLTRIEVHFDDANARKGGSDDKRCTLEARPASMQPLSTSATGATARQALKGASAKLKRLLTTRLAKRSGR